MEIVVSKGHSRNHEMPKSRNTVNHQGQTNNHIQSDGKPFGDFIFVSYIVSATCTVRSVQLKVPVSDRLAPPFLRLYTGGWLTVNLVFVNNLTLGN